MAIFNYETTYLLITRLTIKCSLLVAALHRSPYHVYIVPRSIPMMGSGPSLRGEAKAVRYSSNITNTGLAIGDVFKVPWLIL